MARSPHLGFVSSFAKATLMVPAERSFSLPEIVAVMAMRWASGNLREPRHVPSGRVDPARFAECREI